MFGPPMHPPPSLVFAQNTRIAFRFHINASNMKLFANMIPPKTPAITAAYPVGLTQTSSLNPSPKRNRLLSNICRNKQLAEVSVVAILGIREGEDEVEKSADKSHLATPDT